MNAMTSLEIVPIPSGPARQFHPAVRRAEQRGVEALYDSHSISEMVYAELDGLAAGSAWLNQLEHLESPLGHLLCSFKAMRLNNLAALEFEVGEAEFNRILRSYETASNAEILADQGTIMVICSLMKQSKKSLHAMEQGLCMIDPLHPRMANLIATMIAQENLLLSSARRLMKCD